MKNIFFLLMAVLTMSMYACTPEPVTGGSSPGYNSEYCENVAKQILESTVISDPFDTLMSTDILPSKIGFVTVADVDMLTSDCQSKGIPFTRQLLTDNLPVNAPCKYSEVQRYNNFIAALYASDRTEEPGALESFVSRQNKGAARDCNADMLAMTYATVGHQYGENIAWDLNRVGVSNGRILALDAYMANYYFTTTLDDNFVEFEPDGIIWLSEVSGGNWLIGTEFPIYVNGTPYGPFGWGNELVYDPTISNETVNQCGQITSFVDGNVIGPIGGGVTSISVFGVVAPVYSEGCSE